MTFIPGSSGTYKTYEDTNRNIRVTEYGSGIISLSTIIAQELSSSIREPYSIIGDLFQEIGFDNDTYYNEIPRRTYVSESRPTSLIDKKQYNYKYSPQSNINFRRIDRDPKGRSRTVRNSSMDYTDDFYASRSLEQIPSNNSYYYGTGQDAWTSASTPFMSRTNRNRAANKFYTSEVGNTSDNAFQSWGSGSVSSSWEFSYGPEKEVKRRQYERNTKNDIVHDIDKDSSAFDSFGHEDIATLAECSGLYTPVKNFVQYIYSEMFYNENWASGSLSILGSASSIGNLGYVYEGSTITDGILSRSYYITDFIKYVGAGNNSVIFWYVSGLSGNFEIKVNDQDNYFQDERIISNVGILRAYNCAGAEKSCTFYTASWGDFQSFDPECYCRDLGDTNYTVFQVSCSLMLNSCECIASGTTLYSYSEFLVSTNYPLVDEGYFAPDNLYETQGFTFGNFIEISTKTQGGQQGQDTYNHWMFQLPIVNFCPDGNIKMISVDNNYRLFFTETGETWTNKKIYKVSYFISMDRNNLFLELMINDKYINRFPLRKIIAALGYMYSAKNFPPSYYDTDSYQCSVLWSWFGSVYTPSYDEYEIYSIRNVRFIHYLTWNTAQIENLYFNDVSRVYNEEVYHSQMRKKFAGSMNRGARYENEEDNGECLVVSCSDYYNLLRRTPIHLIERCNKLFKNNTNKTWFYNEELFPSSLWYVPSH